MKRPMSKLILIGALSAGLAAGAVLGKPIANVTAKKRPNINAAQKSCQEAWDKVIAAQKANEWDVAGHAQKAKDLLEQASSELKLATEAAN
jgi:hypothetical protein